MKFTVATTILASAVPVVADASLRDAADALHRGLGISTNGKEEITAILKERRAFKRQNGNAIRNLKNKLKYSEIRNQAEDESNAMSEIDLDIGFFSRGLQSNITVEEPTVIEELSLLCSGEDENPELSCTCSSLDLEAYTASVSCAYTETCLNPTQNACGGEATFCFVETYNLEVTGPGIGSASTCYEVNSPMEFSYCYGLSYYNDEGSPSGCFLEVDGNICGSCEFDYDTVFNIATNSTENVTCNVFDCSSVDAVIGYGTVCGDDTIVARKIEDYLTYAPLPCEGGCNICPLDGSMTNLDNKVALDTGEEYFCYQWNLFGLLGYLQVIPGDLCNTLPAIVGDICGCSTTNDISSEPDDVPSEPETESVPDTTDAPVEAPAGVPETVPVEIPDAPTSDTSAAPYSRIQGFFPAAAAVTTTVFSWMAM
mmetsp:Transcript_3515/g.7681  ORF Transcript_3515/g.7681 Transcript_3515/m.7681 type:complete len:427 (+) Transcript_3515:129-1409(+)